MSIKFVCSCGKRLRARDEMAARRSVCPRCGAPVGIPSGQAAQRGASAGPLSPAERLSARRVSGAGPARTTPAAVEILPLNPASEPLRYRLARLVVPRRHHYPRRSWELEVHWYESLRFPLRAWPITLPLAGWLAGLTGGVALLVPELRDASAPAVGPLVFGAAFLLAPLLILAYACGFLQCVLTAAAQGETRRITWPGRDVGLALKGLATWVFGFLAGPCVPAALALLFWLQCGSPTLLDRLILAELAVFAASYWVLVLLAVGVDGPAAALPWRVADLAHRLGFRTLAAVLLGSAVLLAHGGLAAFALLELHRDLAVGGLALAAAWAGGLFWAAFLFRWLGVCCYRARLQLPTGEGG